VLFVRRALSHLDRTVIYPTRRDLMNGDAPLQIDTKITALNVKLLNARLNHPDPESVIATKSPLSVPLNKILRVSNREGELRVIYLDDGNQMRIARPTGMSGALPCDALEMVSNNTSTALPTSFLKYCKEMKGLQWTDVEDYVAPLSVLRGTIKFTR
jgi:hypothetical protein